MNQNDQFPEVSRAYVPNTTISPRAVTAMALAGSLTAILGGFLVGVGLLKFWDAGEIARLILVLPLPIALGFGISTAVELAGRATGNHNRKLSIFVRVASSFLSSIFVFLNSIEESNFAPPEPVFGPIAGIAILAAIVVSAGSLSVFDASDPFCDEHKKFMIPSFLLIAFSAAKEAFDILARREFKALYKLPSVGSGPGEVIVTIWHCPLCSNGFIEMMIKTPGGTDDANTGPGRLVHSSKLSIPEANLLSSSKQ